MPTTQLFDPALTSPFSQPAYSGDIGPYQHGSDLYWVCDGYTTGINLQHIVVYKLSSGVFSKIITGFTNSNQNGRLSVFWPGSGTVIYIGWQGREFSASRGNLHTTTFDMATDTFGADNDSGIIAGGSPFLLLDSDANLVMVYSTNCDNAGSSLGHTELRYLVYNGSWSSETIISPTSGTNNLLCALIDANGNIGVFWTTSASIKYTIIASGTITSNVTALSLPTNLGTGPYDAIYDPVTDSIVLAYTSGTFGTRQVNTLIGTPSAIPTFSVVQVADDPSNDNFWDQCWISTDSLGNYSVITWTDATAPRDGVLTRFTSSDLATWTSPSDYYNQVTDPPSPPPSGTELYPLWSRYLADGSFHVTIGMFYDIVASTTFCGVLVYLSSESSQVNFIMELGLSQGETVTPLNFSMGFSLSETLGGGALPPVPGPPPQPGPPPNHCVSTEE